MTTPFDFRAVPLSGTHLIEASAGTGKTYAVAGLYVRLVVEAGLSVDQILVVTFTDAATQELRDRLYARLGEARAALDGPAGPPSGLPPGPPPGVAPSAARARLDQALTRFDEAAVFTIHGFCQRSLSDAAFECGAPFDAEVQGDEGELLQQIADDFWRREFEAVTPLAAEFVVEEKLSPEVLLADVRRHLNRPYLKVRVPPEADAATAVLEQDYLAAFREAQDLWRRHAEELFIHLGAPGLNRTSYKPEQLLTLHAALGDFFADGAALTLPAKFDLATQSRLNRAIKKGHVAPQHPFFAACDALAAAQARLLAHFQADLARRRGRLMDYASAELARRKRELGRLSYDDLLLNLHTALHGEGGGALVRALRARYRAALIDEFQDTDPLQYAIFRRAFATPALEAAAGAVDGAGEELGEELGNELGDRPAPLFFVGDPKQAIYGFRGADVFAYLQGRRDAAHTHTLAVNWRSHPRLIRAVNAWFGGAQPFLLEQIAFAPAQPCPAPHTELVVEGDGPAPFRVWLDAPDSSTQAGDSGRQAGGEDGKKAKKDSKAVHEARAARATAAEVARLLGLAARGRARLGDRPLEGSDIAVLVRSHQQARLIRRALMDAGVASAELGQDSVFASREAASLQTLLAALAQPGDEGRVRAALGDELLERTADELHAFASPDGPGDQPGGEPSDQAGDASGEGPWWAAVDAFRRAHELWAAHGLMRAFRELCREFQIYSRLLAYRDGERRLTNLLHLVELLHRHAGEWHGTAGGAAAWLAARRDGQTTEAQELRLESDERVVRVVTVHKSKGLEYAVVFCPFLAQGKKPPTCLEDPTASPPASAYFHDPEDGYRGVLDLGSEDWQRAARLEHAESRAEELRLAYVALTRARCRCYVVWSAAGGAEHSPLAWLADGRSPAEIADACDGEVEVRPLAEVGADTSPPAPDPEPECHARPFRGRIPEAWRVTSFSALNTGGAAHEAMDTEAVDAAHAGDPGEGSPEFGPEFGLELGDAGTGPGGPDAAGLDAGVRVGSGPGFDPGFAPGDFRSLGREGSLVPGGIPVSEASPVSGGDPDLGRGRLAAVTLATANAHHPASALIGVPPSVGARGPAAGPEGFSGFPPDAVAPPPPGAPPEFPRGAEAGACLHAVFEKLDFSAPDDLDARTAEALAAFGIEPRWRPAARRLVQNALAAPLAPGLRLGALPWAKTVRELEFLHPIARVTPEGLAAVLAAHGRGAGGRLESLGFEPVHGYLRGFVDLVFEHDGRYYLADYKSNWLGPQPADYHAAAMRREMRAAGYELQLLIYTVALHRHLRRRLPDYAYDRHFGGAYYLFLRGMRPGGRHGVYFDRPDVSLVSALDHYFAGGAGSAGTADRPMPPA